MEIPNSVGPGPRAQHHTMNTINGHLREVTRRMIETRDPCHLILLRGCCVRFNGLVEGKILAGNPRFSYEICDFPVIFPLNQSIVRSDAVLNTFQRSEGKCVPHTSPVLDGPKENIVSFPQPGPFKNSSHKSCLEQRLHWLHHFAITMHD